MSNVGNKVTLSNTDFGFLKLLLLFLTFLASPLAQSAEFSLSVNKTIIEEGKSLELSFSYTGETGGEEPDFSQISKNFDVLTKYPSSQRYNINGQKSIVNQWVLHVIPKRKGNLLIPPIQFKGQTSKPTNIQVKTVGTMNTSRDVFLETIIDKSAAYVGEQIKLTFRLYFDTNIDNPQTDQLDINNVEIKEMPTSQYQRRVDGRLYQVADFSYLLKAERDGTIVIPSINWRIRINKSNTQSLFDRFGRFEVEQLRSQEKIVRIKAIPDVYPKNTPWLPASSFELTQAWALPIDQMQPGVPNTRKIEITAQGLDASSLPSIQTDYSDQELKIYAETPELDNSFDDMGSISKSTQSAAVIANKPGVTRLPEIKVAWWNTQTDTLEYAVVPAQSLSSSREGFSGNNTPPPSPKELNNNTSNLEAVQGFDSDTSKQNPSSGNSSPKWILGVLLITNIATLSYCIFLLFKSNQNSDKTDRRNTNTENTNTSKINDILSLISISENEKSWETLYEQITKLASVIHGLSTYRELIDTAKNYEFIELGKELELLEKALFLTKESNYTPSLSISKSIKKLVKKNKDEEEKSTPQALYRE